MRRLPVYLLLDTSGSMKGEPIEAVKTGLRAMIDTLRQDPHALESVHISIITFDREVNVILPLTALVDLQLPELTTPESGPTHTGMALEYLCQAVDKEVIQSSADQKGDWRPIMFLMTDGSPSDKQVFKHAVPEIKKRGFGHIIACAAGDRAKTDDLLVLTNEVYTLETMDGAAFESLFVWVTTVMKETSTSAGVEAHEIPPPPPSINPAVI